MLLLLSLLYMPITRQLMSVLICVEKRCAEGEWYPKQARHAPHRSSPSISSSHLPAQIQTQAHSWESAFLADASFQV